MIWEGIIVYGKIKWVKTCQFVEKMPPCGWKFQNLKIWESGILIRENWIDPRPNNTYKHILVCEHTSHKDNKRTLKFS
jgi:hypothetical protein